MVTKEAKTIKIYGQDFDELNKRRGYNGCRSFADVIKLLLREVKKHE